MPPEVDAKQQDHPLTLSKHIDIHLRVHRTAERRNTSMNSVTLIRMNMAILMINVSLNNKCGQVKPMKSTGEVEFAFAMSASTSQVDP
jgi:hypothetical protein